MTSEINNKNNNPEYNKTQVMKYLIFTFGVAYIIQILTGILYRYENRQFAYIQPVMAFMMFVPMIGVIFCGHGIKNMGYKPELKKNIRTFLIAWFIPSVLTAIGAALYFMIFPDHFDLTGKYMIESAGPEAAAQLETIGIPYSMMILSNVLGCVTYAPLINGIFAMGEEIGWRGFLYPQLKAKFGHFKGLILGGIIWGAWHWPLIWLIGYEYGETSGNPVGYVGAPITGMIVFCIFTVAIGILCDHLYEQSGCILTASILHGSINAAATIPIALCITNTGSLRLLGPAPNGLLAGLPIIVVAIYLLIKKNGYFRIDG